MEIIKTTNRWEEWQYYQYCQQKNMEECKQQQLRSLAKQQAQCADPNQQALAMGTLELLDFVGQLVNELQIATETCCEAMCVVYGCLPLGTKAHRL